MLPDRDKKYPSWLVWFAFNIVANYNIKGVCDFMYIMNVTAVETGTGNGKGLFSDPVPSEAEEIKKAAPRVAERLINSYGCNIPKDSSESIIADLSLSLID